MNKKQEDTLIKIWNRLEGMWFHHQDGSDCVPVPKRFKDAFDPEYNKWQKKWGNESMIFDIVFNEIAHDIRTAISKERHKELR